MKSTKYPLVETEEYLIKQTQSDTKRDKICKIKNSTIMQDNYQIIISPLYGSNNSINIRFEKHIKNVLIFYSKYLKNKFLFF